MSKPAGSKPKSPFLGVLLYAAVIFLGYNLLNPQKPAPRDQKAIFADLMTANREIKDITAARVFSEYEGALGQDKKLTTDERDRLWLQGEVILADTQYKAAELRDDLARVITPADKFIGLQRRFENKPFWNEPVTVSAHAKFPRTSVTPAQLKEDVRELTTDLGKNTPVWGFFPGYAMLNWMVHATGAIPSFSYALTCFLLALFLRLIIFPLTHKQMMWGRQMAQLAPLANEIKAKYQKKDGKQMTMEETNAMNQAVMALYKEYGFNPMSGCAPMVLQMPLFFLVYQSMQHYRFEFEQGLFLWINPGVGHATNGFLASNLGQKDYLLILIYGITMITSTLLMPVSDPTNAKQGKMMGLMMSATFAVMMFFIPVPSAFTLYWVFLNILATAQSLWSYRLPLKPLEKKITVTGGVIPSPNGGTLNGITASGPRKTGVPQKHTPKKKK